MLPFVYGQFFLHLKISENSNTNPICTIALQQMINSLHVMVACLMSNRTNSNFEDDRRVKFFLSCCHRFSLAYYGRGVTPFWASTGNFPSLLNINSQVSEFGPLRWYWEGTRERFIQTVKKVLVSMRRSASYFSKKLTIVQKLNVLSWIRMSIRRKKSKASEQSHVL